MVKTCTKCKRELPLTTKYFTKDKKIKDGYSIYCKECKKKLSKIYDANRKDKISLYHKTYDKEYRGKNKDKINKRNRERNRKNPSKRRLYEHKRIALKEKLVEIFTIEQWIMARIFFDNKCAYCGEEKKLTQDHFIPLSKGGNYVVENIIPACNNCNSSKGNKDFDKWYKKYPKYSEAREEKVYEYLSYCKISKEM